MAPVRLDSSDPRAQGACLKCALEVDGVIRIGPRDISRSAYTYTRRKLPPNFMYMQHYLDVDGVRVFSLPPLDAELDIPHQFYTVFVAPTR